MARSFNGTSDIITFPAVTPSGVANSVSFWFYPVSTAGTYKCVHNMRTSTINFEGIFQSGASATKMTYFSNGGTNIDPGTNAFNLNAWNHVALVLSASGTTMTAYLNNVLDGTGSWAVPVAQIPKLGWDSTNTHWGGRLADYAFWNGAALTAAEVSALANGARPYTIRPQSLQIYAPLDGLQSPEPDLSGKGNNGTLTGTTAIPGPPVAPFTRRWSPSPPPPPPPYFTIRKQIRLNILQTGP